MALSDALQTAVAAALLAAPAVTTRVAATADGPAVFAPHQALDPDAWDRVTLEVPQVLGADLQCGRGRSECFATVHSWSSGPEASLRAGALADAVREALDAALTVVGHRVVTHRFESSRPVGDPNPDVEHVVSVFRYLIHPTG